MGAPQIITDDAGSIVWQAEYLPFGKVNILTAEIENNLRFPGQYYDTETGLHYNWNRYYSPETGRYIAADPIGLGGGINLYRYADANPANWYDSDGLNALVMYEAGTGAVAGGQSNADRNKNIARGLQGYVKKCLSDIQIAWLIAKGVWHVILNECDGEECAPPDNLPDFDFDDPTKAPVGPDGVPWDWKGKPPQGGAEGGYKNPNGPDSLHPDLDHDEPVGPHWDYNDRKGPGWRIKPDGTIEPK